MKKILSLFCAALIVFSSISFSLPPAFALDSNGTGTKAAGSSEDAAICKDLGIIKGAGNGVTSEYISTHPARLQAAIMLLRLRGLEDAAISYQGKSSFSDANAISAWKNGVNILSYLKENPKLGFAGDGYNFYPEKKITAQEYIKVLLNALGYKIGPKGDCGWSDIIAFAGSIGLTKAAVSQDFTVEDLASYTVQALKSPMKNSTKTLAESLVDSKTISAEVADQYDLLDQGTERIGIMTEFSGSVSVYQSSAGKTVAAQKGMDLTEGDIISTKSNSWVNINLDGDKKIKLSDNTVLELTQVREKINDNTQQTYLTLNTGKVWVDISNKLRPGSRFLVKAGQTILSVKGTQFFVGEEDGHTDCAVLDGTVCATAYIPVEDPEGGDQMEELEVVLQENQQVILDDTVQSDTELDIEQITNESLDLFVLETISEDPEGIDQSLLNGIDQVIEQRQNEEEPNTADQRPSHHHESNPNVVIAGLTDMEPGVGDVHTISFTVSPSDAEVSVTGDAGSSLAAIDAYEITGSEGAYTLTVTSSAITGTAILTVSASRSGYDSASQSIAVHVMPDILLQWPDSPFAFSDSITPTPASIDLGPVTPYDAVFDFEYDENNGVFDDPQMVDNLTYYTLTVNPIAPSNEPVDLTVIVSKDGYRAKEFLVKISIIPLIP